MSRWPTPEWWEGRHFGTFIGRGLGGARAFDNSWRERVVLRGAFRVKLAPAVEMLARVGIGPWEHRLVRRWPEGRGSGRAK